jgi:hypothetical protein
MYIEFRRKKLLTNRRNRNSHSGGYEDFYLLVYNAVNFDSLHGFISQKSPIWEIEKDMDNIEMNFMEASFGEKIFLKLLGYV